MQSEEGANMTKDEWQEAERRALWKYGGLTLLVDGYKISVQRQYATPYKSKLAVYVNGTFRGKWLVEDCEERRRFCYCVKHSLIKKNCPENKKKWFLKAMGKNEEDYAYYTYSPYYPSFAALRRQLVKNNQDIQLIWLDLATAWNETWTTYISPIFTAFCEVVQDVCDIIQRLWTEVIDPILASLVTSLTELWNTHLSPLFSDLIAVGGDAINAIATVIKALWDNVIDPLANWLLSTFGPVFTQVFNSVAGIVTNAIGIVADVLDIGLICLQAVIDFMRNVFEGDWEAAWQVVQDAVSDIWDVISDRIRGAINNIIGFVNGMISAIVSGLNTVINGLNSLSFDAPSWVTDLTGISSFGFNIGTVTAPQIPYLAQGAVIPANREFLAVLGDQSHGTNVEAPLDTIKQAVAEVMEDLQAGQMAGFEAVVSVLREILSAVYGIELTDEDVGRAVQRWQRKQAIATGGV